MAYIVPKKVGQKYQYLYWQESFRAPDGSVKTNSKYLGPVGPVSGVITSKVEGVRTEMEILLGDSQEEKEQLSLLSKKVREGVQEALDGNPSLKKFTGRLKEQNTALKLDISSMGRISDVTYIKSGIQIQGASLGHAFSWKGLQKQGLQVSSKSKKKNENAGRNPRQDVVTTNVDLSGRISMNALQYEQSTVIKNMFGMSPENANPISLCYGSTIAHKRVWGKKYVVTLLKEGGSRTQVKHEFSKAVMKSGLEQLARERPEEYRTLIKGFKVSHKQTHKHIGKYMDASSSLRKKRIGKLSCGNVRSLSLHFFGKLNSKGLPKNSKALGLHSYKDHRSPKEELSSLLVEINKRGFETLSSEFNDEMRHAEKEVGQAVKARKSTWIFTKDRKKANQRCKKAIARYRAQGEMQKKLKMIQHVLFKEKTKNFQPTTEKASSNITEPRETK